MAVLTVEQVCDLAYAAGFREDALAIATAVTTPESGRDTTRIGDERLMTSKWGESVGLWQVRTLKAELGTGRSRDKAGLLASPAKQARSAYEISGGGTSFRPWSVFTSGAYRAHMAAAVAAAKARMKQGGSGSISGGGTTGAEREVDTATGIATLSPDVIIPAGDLPVLWRPPASLADLVIERPAGALNLADYVVAGSMELTAAQTSELTLELLNPDRSLRGSGRGNIGLRDTVTWGDLTFTVAAEETGGGAGSPRLSITCRDYGVEELKRTNVDASGKGAGTATGVDVSGKNLSPTEYAAIQARAVGLRFMGEASARRTDIAPKRDDASGVYESPWEVIDRLATELGYRAFVSAGVLYFGRARWLAAQATEVKVGFGGAWGDPALDALEEPVYRDTVDSFDGATLSVVLPRWRGEQVRPGMRMVTRGVYGLGGTAVWLVERVRWNIDAGESPVEVDAVIPVDKPVRAKEGPAGDPAATTTTEGTPTAPTTATYKVGQRIGTAQRKALFGQPGDGARFVQYRTPWGLTVTVHRDVKDRFAQACTNAATRSSWRPRRIDSLAVRQVRGSDDWSLHAFALAWDFFSSAPGVPPPGGVWGPESAPDAAFRAEFAKLGFHLGADYTRRKDYPHIEWASAPPPAPSARVT